MVTEEQAWTHLYIDRGITAIIGSGGKTTLLLALGAWFCRRGSVLLTTSTHIYPPEGIPWAEQVKKPLHAGDILAVGSPGPDGKLGAPVQSFSELNRLADYMFIEADGSKGLPLKAHAAHEPVIPKEARTVLAVVGLDGIGKPIREAAHRPLLYAERLGCEPDAIVTVQMAARIVNGYKGVTGVILNKADTMQRLSVARELAVLLDRPVAIAVLQSEPKFLELWRNGTCWLS